LSFLAMALLPVRVWSQREASAPHWIWHSSGDASHSFPAETRYFRKRFEAKEVSRLALEVTADNSFALYLDGKIVAEGNDWNRSQSVEARLSIGRHVLAARATNEAPGPAGFLVSGGVLPLGQGAPIQTDRSWKTASHVPPGDGWTQDGFDDSAWTRAVDLGVLGSGPWGRLVFSGEDLAKRFRVPDGFTIETAAQGSVTGSVVAFTFDPAGQPCVSIEQGSIARLIDDDKDGRYDHRQPITTQMRNCQGLSFIRDHLYAVGDGPRGTGLYRLDDPDKDGVFDKAELIRAAKGGMGEHGPHAVMLGPDGRLYYNNGNHAHLKPPIDPASPVNVAYEGELLPHYNDSRGHAAGIMAPGGEIYRSDDEGRSWIRVVAGFRNEYDFAFNGDGEMLTFDSDMEWDVGLPWYRPVRVNHCATGAEFGWRNGSGKWPAYYFDSLPATLDVGRGSPTGVTFYQASQFPDDYRERFLICDWSQGRILAVKLVREGATYKATADEIVSGQPLNCTDIEAGPDGSVYFTTGGRGTQGGLFRVSWTGPRTKPSWNGVFWMEAIEIDSPQSSFSRRRIDEIRREQAGEWDKALERVARDPGQLPRCRVRALELLCQFGPQPSDQLLIDLAADRQADVRSRAIGLLGLRTGEPVRRALERALADRDSFVKRHACEGLMQQPATLIPVDRLLPLLSDSDRWIRFAARVAIEHADLGRHRDRILSLYDPRARVEGMLALVRATRLDEAGQNRLLERETHLLRGNLDQALTQDLLRLIELTFLLGPRKVDSSGAGEFRSSLLSLFSTSTDTPGNREIARLLAFLNEPKAVPMILAHQGTVADHSAQIHDAYCLRAIKQGWTAETRQKLWSWYETASRWEGGYSFAGYLDYMIQELIAPLDAGARSTLLAEGEKFPFPTRVLVRRLSIDHQPEVVSALVSLYGRLVQKAGAGVHVEDLKGLIVEKLGRSDEVPAHTALRNLLALDPNRRDQIARALADHPADADSPIFVQTLKSRDPNTMRAVAKALLAIKSSPAGAEGLGNLIRMARKTGPPSRSLLNDLAARWTGEPKPAGSNTFEGDLAAWEEVYHRRFPAAPLSSRAEETGTRSYELPQLVNNVLKGEVARTASAKRGQEVMVRGRCLDCHKFGDKGAGLGPDLTTLNSRFQPADILESIVVPSKVISDQYKSITVATQDGKLYNGMPIVADGPSLVLLLSDGTKATIPKAEIDEQKASATSVMPEGLLNPLSFQEIADLMALFNSMPRVAVPEASATKGK
jgi:putative heme-binding domain-containing protein